MGVPSMVQHGFARTQAWALASTTVTPTGERRSRVSGGAKQERARERRAGLASARNMCVRGGRSPLPYALTFPFDRPREELLKKNCAETCSRRVLCPRGSLGERDEPRCEIPHTPALGCAFENHLGGSREIRRARLERRPCLAKSNETRRRPFQRQRQLSRNSGARLCFR